VEENPDLLRLCTDVRRRIAEKLSSLQLQRNDRAQIFFALQLVRGLSLFDSVLLLSNAGLAGGAAIVLRSLQELVFVTEAIQRDPNRLALLIAADEEARRKSLTGLKKLPNDVRAANVTDESIDEILNEVDPASKGQSVYKWAEMAGREDDYRTAYVLLSAEVHATLRSAEAHLKVDETTGEIKGILGWLGHEHRLLHLLSASVCAPIQI